MDDAVSDGVLFSTAKQTIHTLQRDGKIIRQIGKEEYRGRTRSGLYIRANSAEARGEPSGDLVDELLYAWKHYQRSRVDEGGVTPAGYPHSSVGFDVRSGFAGLHDVEIDGEVVADDGDRHADLNRLLIDKGRNVDSIINELAPMYRQALHKAVFGRPDKRDAAPAVLRNNRGDGVMLANARIALLTRWRVRFGA
jgi:hypothetical protein